jgi:thiol-disulfide isomerase/thioredoxin
MKNTKIHLNGINIIWLTAMILILPVMCRAESLSIFSDTTFDAALKQAETEKKVVLIDFFTTWCGPCKMLDKTTWTDAKVATLLAEKAVALKIDAEKESTLAEKYDVKAYPTVLILKADGTIVDRLVGYRPPETFISDFNAALAGKTSLIRARDEASSGDGVDPMKREKLGSELARSGRNEEALKEFLWCYDEGLKHDSSFVGVRNSFLVSYIAQLGKHYPPAVEALKTRRDAAKQVLSATPADRDAASDFASLNHVLDEDQTTLAYFDELPANSPTRLMIGYHIFDLLLEAKRYSEAAQVRPYGRFVRTFEAERARFKQMDHAKLPPGAGDSLREFAIESASKEIEALAGAGKQDEVRELLEKVLDFDHSDETTVTLHKHLERAGHADFLTKSGMVETVSSTKEKEEK